MRPYTNKEIIGNWATLLLATGIDGFIDYKKLGDEIDILIASNPNGIYSNGTAGEFYTLTEKEFEKTSMLLAAKCNSSGTPFQIGVSHPSPQISLQRLKRVKILKPCAVQVILPDWFPVTLEEAVIFLQKMEEAADGISLVLYNPPHAKKRLNPEEWSVLKKQVSSLASVKVFDDNGSPEWYANVRKYSKGLSVFIPGHRLATGIKLGANGAYSNMACLNPFATQKWYNLIVKDMNAGLELESRVGVFMKKFIEPLITVHQYPNHACDRFMAVLGGWADVGEKLRWPYKSVPHQYADEIKEEARSIIPEFFEKF
ncbi:MAG: dihydrodipicolinate synthase family protein [Fidelibacterota bacterium]